MPVSTLLVNRKSLIVIFLLLFLCLDLSPITQDPQLARTVSFAYLSSLSRARETPLAAAKKDYIQETDSFASAKNTYITAKSSYISFRTATAKADAFIKTKAYLEAADNLLLSYLDLVQAYGSETKWQSSSFDKVTSDQAIAEQIGFIKDNLAGVQNTQTLEELPPLANSLKTQLTNITQPKISKVTQTYDIAQTESVFANYQVLSQKLNEFVGKRITPENQTLLANWQSEINDIREKTQTNLVAAKDIYYKIKDNRLNSSQIKQTDQALTKAKTELKRSKGLFVEMTQIL